MNANLFFALFLTGIGLYLSASGLYFFMYPEKHSPIAEIDRGKLNFLLRIRFALVIVGGLGSIAAGLFALVKT